MSYETIIYEKEKGIGTIIFNRPNRLNALNEKLLDELSMILDEIENDDVRVVIITGGEKCFSAGFDLKETRTSSIVFKLNKIFTRIERFGKPVIAAINGYALGGGCEIALCCNLRVASETANIGLPEVKVGTISAGGGTFRLPRLIGMGRAKEMLYTGKSLNGKEAFNIGLINKVVPRGKVLDEARRMVGILLERPPLSIKTIKDCIHAGIQFDTENAIDFVINSADLLRGTEDYKEGWNAFTEKRKPIWKGR